MIFVNNEPKNSSSPKLSNRGKNKPAKRKIENSTVSKSLNTKLPVSPLIINSGPICNAVNIPNTPPTTLVINQGVLTLKSEFKKSLFIS